ncbi:MAG: hypothetical protein ACOYI2_05955 [Bacillota bacterium]|jgi:hypothetical protein
MITNIYLEWGFQETPFETKPLPPSSKGVTLLVGRDDELRRITQRLYTSSNIITVEGQNGIGKTSLVNIAVYKKFKEYLDNGIGPFFIPCDTSFQLAPDRNIEDFIDEVLMAVAQTLINRRKDLEDFGYKLDGNKTIDKWLNAPQLNAYNATIVNIGLGKQVETNTSVGFQRSGFRVTILNWLKEIFPFGQNGGVVCIIDNLELLLTSEAARKQLELLRDTLFSYNGLRWVLCGSSGIVLGVASSPRLEGRLQDPIEIEGIDRCYASEIFRTRINTNAINPKEAYLPITSKEFEHLYNILNYNIRNTLHYAEVYCFWIIDHGYFPKTNEEKSALYYQWLEAYSNAQREAMKLNTRALQVFQTGINKFAGAFSYGDFADFGFNSISAMRSHISTLEKFGLVTSFRDEGDKRRKTIQVTPKGFFYNYGLYLSNMGVNAKLKALKG